MSDVVGNPEARFSGVAAHIFYSLVNAEDHPLVYSVTG